MMRLALASCRSVALAVAACRERAKAGDGPYADKVADDVPKIEQALGVKFKTPPKLELAIARSGARVPAAQAARAGTSEAVRDAGSDVYKLLGMLPDTLHLADFYVKVLTEQIMGYYDPKTKVLYVVKDAPDGIRRHHDHARARARAAGPVRQSRFARGDLPATTIARRPSQAVIEGQATYEQMYIMAGGSGTSPRRCRAAGSRFVSTIREAAGARSRCSRPRRWSFRKRCMFPYINGADFVRRFKAHEPGKLPFDKLPVSTEQLMHDAAPTSEQRPTCRAWSRCRAIPGTVDDRTTSANSARGCSSIQHTRDQDRSIRASNGWDGDRYALVKTPEGNALVWATVWDTPGDAAEFMSALDAVMAERDSS